MRHARLLGYAFTLRLYRNSLAEGPRLDLAWPEAFRALFLQGVELVLVPSYWVADDITDAGMKHDPE